MPDIIEVLGERPYGMSESVQNYLTEMKSSAQSPSDGSTAEKEEDSHKSDDEEDEKKEEEVKKEADKKDESK